MSGQRDGARTDTFVLIRGGWIVLPDRVIEGGAVLVSGGRITRIYERGELLPAGHREIDASGSYVAPGYVELHIHGAGAWGFESRDPEALEHIARYLSERGITAFVPTLQCELSAVERVAAALDASPSLRDRALGLYVEGPFVSERRRGGILPETLRTPRRETLEAVIDAARGYLRLMTVAPELPGSHELFDLLRERRVIPCLGHSDCRLDELPDLASGVFNITHLFNGMSPISHKQSGLAMLPFLDSRPFVELNGDGVHLSAESIRFCYRHLSHERLVLISDAVVSAGLGEGRFEYFGRPVVSSGSGVRYEDGTLIGSNCLIPEVVRRFVQMTGAPVHAAVRFATLNPSRLLGVDGERGSIAPGRRAELILLDKELRVTRNLSPELLG